MYNSYPNYNLNRNNNYPQDISYYYQNNYPDGQDERFLWAPFVVGGLAGTALGFGIANNNQLNNQCCPGHMVYPYPVYQQVPYYTNSNNYYY